MQFPLTVPGSLAQHASKEAHCIAHNCVRLGRSHRSTDLEEGFGGPFWRKISCVCVTCGLSGVKKRTSGRHHSNQVGIIATDRRYTLMVCSLSLSQNIPTFSHPLSLFHLLLPLSLSLKKSGNIETSISIFPLFHLPSSLSLSQNIPTFSPPLSLFHHHLHLHLLSLSPKFRLIVVWYMPMFQDI